VKKYIEELSGGKGVITIQKHFILFMITDIQYCKFIKKLQGKFRFLLILIIVKFSLSKEILTTFIKKTTMDNLL